MKNKTFNDLMDSIKELHDKKNHDYASENNPYSNFEFASLLIREFTDPVDQSFACLIGVKLARLGQLLSGKEPNNESVEDTMRDLTTYCGIWAAWRIDNQKRLEIPYHNKTAHTEIPEGSSMIPLTQEEADKWLVKKKD